MGFGVVGGPITLRALGPGTDNLVNSVHLVLRDAAAEDAVGRVEEAALVGLAIVPWAKAAVPPAPV